MDGMDDVIEHESASATPSDRPRIPYACEACRAAKVKCQPSNTQSICRRCSVSKRECIFKTGPRPRRRRSKLHPEVTRTTPPPSQPSKTFTINVPMPAEELGASTDPSDTLDALRESHEGFLDALVPDDDLKGDDTDMSFTNPPSLASGSGTFSTSTRSTTSRSVQEFSSIQPQFNLDSATALLSSFREGMLPYFPVVTLPTDSSVRTLARESPFILLAILAAASGNECLQGHNLYDEEFRRVLGLKFVSGGERSLDLLVGLLIYCAWFPFHLRPKTRQAFQYVRMASDIVHDLDLDQSPDDACIPGIGADKERMAGIRAYLACQYVCSSFASIWQRNRTLPFQQWTAKCCDILLNSTHDQTNQSDRTLAWLVRLANIVEECCMLHRRKHQTPLEGQHILLIVRGMEAQLHEWQGQIPSEILSQPILRLAHLFTVVAVHGYSLMKYRTKSKTKGQFPEEAQAGPARLLLCANALGSLYDYVDSLPTSELAHFPGVYWGYFVISIILGLRLSFPMPEEIPGWDHAAARQILDLGSFLTKFSDLEGSGEATMAPASSKGATKTNVVCASKVVVDVVRRKYERRVAMLEMAVAGRTQQPPPHSMPQNMSKTLYQCPMFDGSLDKYILAWDNTFTTNFADPPHGTNAPYGTRTGTGFESEGAQPVIFHDLWATMTMGWTQDGWG